MTLAWILVHVCVCMPNAIWLLRPYDVTVTCTLFSTKPLSCWSINMMGVDFFKYFHYLSPAHHPRMYWYCNKLNVGHKKTWFTSPWTYFGDCSDWRLIKAVTCELMAPNQSITLHIYCTVDSWGPKLLGEKNTTGTGNTEQLFNDSENLSYWKLQLSTLCCTLLNAQDKIIKKKIDN